MQHWLPRRRCEIKEERIHVSICVRIVNLIYENHLDKMVLLTYISNNKIQPETTNFVGFAEFWALVIGRIMRKMLLRNCCWLGERRRRGDDEMRDT